MPEELKLFAVSAVVTDVDRDTGYAREEAQLPAFLVTATDGERAMAKAARVINAPGREARIMVIDVGTMVQDAEGAHDPKDVN